MIDLHRLVARVSFVTGWTRDYVLHSLTFKQFVRYAEYAVEWQKENARLNAVELGLTLGLLQRVEPEQVKVSSSVEDDGVDELLRRNVKWLTHKA